MITKQIENLKALNEQDALNKAQIELNIPKVYLKALLTKKEDQFNNYTIMVSKSPAILGKEYIESIYGKLDLDLKMEFKTQDEGKLIVFNLQSNNNGLIIGKNGAALEALQYLLRQFLQNLSTEKIVVNVDIGGYRQRRINQLERLATLTAKDVMKNKIDVTLADLTSFERRVIHNKLADWQHIETISYGEGRERKLVISYKKDKPQENQEEKQS